jgi:hypothetical protein
MRSPRVYLAFLVAAALGVAVPAAAQDAPASADASKPVDVPGFWTDGELAAIDEGLAAVNASRADLGFFKRPIEDPFRLDVVNRALDEPLSMGREAAEWDRTARKGELSGLLINASRTLVGTAGASSGVANEFPNATSAVPEPLRAPLADLLRHIHWAKHKLGKTGDFVGKEGDARRRLLEKALRTQVESPAGAKPADLLEDAAFREAVKGAGRKLLLEHAGNLAGDVEALVSVLRTLPPESLPKEARVVSDTVEFGIPLIVVIAGTGNDVHGAFDADLVLDFGGNDTYLQGASANLLEDRAASVVIDLAGDDRYVGESDLSFGGALGGVAIQWDCGGNDTYRAGHCSLGAGILGVGVLVDEGGDEVFRSKDFGQGAGAFGVGVLLKKGGNDLYHADLFGQGFASTWGCGVLADLGGNDVYDAGGAHLHEPLYRDRYQALSQGFAIGMRPDASGGVGVLVDVSGNDRYQTDIYGQGSSYWYSLGLLIDDDGHDTYNGTHYCQGTGIHLSAAMLLDRAGNDSYHCLNGVGVGGSHDFAAGILLDRGGDDHYSGSGASQGCGHTNGVGILLDGAGDDGYCAVRGLTQGDASTVRNSGGIGLLLDQGGKDVYSEPTRDEGVWIRGLVGAGIDKPSSAPAGPGGPQAPVVTKEEAAARVENQCMVEKDGKRTWDLDRLWALSSEWAVNDNSVIVPIARERLAALGDPALDRAFDRLKSCGIGSGLEFQAVEAVMKLFAATDRRPAIETRLLEKTKDEDHLTRRGAVAVIASLQVTAAVPRLVEMLPTDEKNRRSILGALGALKQAPKEVAGYLRSKNELEGINAAVCLGAVGDDAALASLAAALGGDVPYLTRTAAAEQLAVLAAEAAPADQGGGGVAPAGGAAPEAGTAPAKDGSAAKVPTERASRAVAALSKVVRDAASPATARRNALRALGRTGHPDALDPIAESLSSPDPLVRLSAVGAGRSYAEKSSSSDAAEMRVALEVAKNVETDPLVKRFR